MGNKGERKLGGFLARAIRESVLEKWRSKLAEGVSPKVVFSRDEAVMNRRAFEASSKACKEVLAEIELIIGSNDLESGDGRERS